MKKLTQLLKRFGVVDFGVMAFERIVELRECRAKSRLPREAKTVIVCLFPYSGIPEGIGESSQRNLCRYATFVDYHVYIHDLLEQVCVLLRAEYGGQFAPFVDNSPIPEVFCAQEAGLGFRGRHNLLITKRYGSYVLLGEIVTDLPFPLSTPCTETCLDCGLCKIHCPNGAITETGMDYTRCVSAISQRKGALTGEEAAAIRRAGVAWGCDRCQEVCPHNQGLETTPIQAFLQDIQPTLTAENLDTLLQTRAFGYKGEALMRRNLEILGE